MKPDLLQAVLSRLPAAWHRILLKVGNQLRNAAWRLLGQHRHGVSLVAFDKDGQILLVRHSYGSSAWATPGGGLKRGEDPAACARRELSEELGCAAHGLELAGTLTERVFVKGWHTSHVFAVLLNQHPCMDGREIVETQFFDPERLPTELSPPSARRVMLCRDHPFGKGSVGVDMVRAPAER